MIVCNSHDYCRVAMPKEHEIIKYTPWDNSIKAPFIIYANLECLLRKVRSCQSNPENVYTEKNVKCKPSGYAWCSISSFDETNPDAIFIGEKIVLKSFVGRI